MLPSSTARLRRPLAAAVGLLALAVVVAVLLPVVVPAYAQTAERPLIWQGHGGASGVVVDVNTEPRLLPINEFVHGEMPHATTNWTSNGLATAQASSFYPGTSGTQGPALMCDFGLPCEQIPGFPPTYPLTVTATPGNPQASTQSGYASAEVDGNHVFARAAANNQQGINEALAALEAAFTTSKAEATSLQEFVDGTLVVTASSRVEDLDFGGGAFTVDSIEGRSEARVDGESAAGGSTTTIQGAAVGGQPVVIGSDGVTVAGQGGGGEENDEANRQLNEQLAQQGIRVRTVGDDHTNEDGRSSGRAGGLLVQMTVEVPVPPGSGEVPQPPSIPGVPVPVPGTNTAFRTYLFTMVFGNAATSAFATNEGFVLGGLGGDLGGLAPTDPVAPPTENTGPLTPPSVGGPIQAPTTSGGPPAAPPEVAPEPAAADGQPFAFGVLGGSLAQRVTAAYVVLGAFALVLTISTGFVSRWIRPGPTSSEGDAP